MTKKSVSKEEAMREAIRQAEIAVDKGQKPFGACVVNNNRIISAEHASVQLDNDITAHAELKALRQACRVLGTTDLAGSIVYASGEPCPMCFTAAHLAGVSKIIFAGRQEDALHYGIDDGLNVSDETLKKLVNSPVQIEGDFLRAEVLAIFRKWSHRDTAR